MPLYTPVNVNRIDIKTKKFEYSTLRNTIYLDHNLKTLSECASYTIIFRCKEYFLNKLYENQFQKQQFRHELL